jgi:hypothetical protein
LRDGLARGGAQYLDVPFMRPQEAKEQGNGGRFSCAVWPQKSDGLSRLDLDIEMVHGEVPTVATHDALEPQSRMPAQGIGVPYGIAAQGFRGSIAARGEWKR